MLTVYLFTEVKIMNNDALKEAKQRLKRMSLLQNGDDSFFLNNKRVSLTEIGRMREVTAEILASDSFINPIEKLIDQSEFERIDDEGKMRYILDLSSIYVCLKNSMKE